MDDFYYEESSPKHVFIKCLIICLILGIIFGAFLYYKKKNTIHLKDITIELGSNLSNNILDYLDSGEKFVSDYKLDLSDVNVNKVGVYNYTAKYNKHVENGKIVVKDTIKPEVEVLDITVGTDEDIKAIYLVSSCKDLALPCSATFEGDVLKKIKKPGTYDVVIRVSDASGNTVSKSAKITSSDEARFSSVMTNDLVYYSNSLNDNSIGDTLFNKLDSAMDEDTIEFETLMQKVSIEDFNLYTDKELSDTKLIIAYNKYGYVIGVQVLATYEDGNQELLTNVKVNNEE